MLDYVARLERLGISHASAKQIVDDYTRSDQLKYLAAYIDYRERDKEGYNG